MATMNCARSCSPLSEEERQNIMKWSENIENLLRHDSGRESFKSYLTDLDVEEDVDCIEFWEMSEDLERLAQELLDSRGSPSIDEETSPRNRFNAKSSELVSFAVDRINFDLQQLKELNRIKDNPADCKTILPKARATILYLLKQNYEEFIRKQFNERLSSG